MSGTDYTRTANYNLYKPIYDADVDQWADHLNWNADTLDSTLHGLSAGQAGGPFLPLSGGIMGGTLAGYAITMNPGGGNVVPAYPVGNSLPTAEYTPANGIVAQLVCQSQSTSATNPEWTGVFGNWSTAGQASGAQKVALYAGSVQSPGSGPAWSLNTLVTRNASPGANNTPGGPGNIGSGTPGSPGAIPLGTVTIGYELDWNNFDQDLAPGSGFGVGMWINMLGSYAATSAIYLSNHNDSAKNNYGWHNGITFAGDHLIQENAIFDGSHAAYSYQDGGVHGGASYYAADTSPVALAIGGNHTLADITVNDNAPTVLKIAGSHTHVFDPTGATISGTVYNGPFTASQVAGTQTGGGAASAVVAQATSNASHAWYETGAAADAKKWDVLAGGGSLFFRTLSDSEGATNIWLSVGRAAASPTAITLTAANIVLQGVVTANSINNTPVGATTASTGAFTTLVASGAVSGAGFTARFASPGPIGNTTASTGQFTTVNTTGNIVAAGGAGVGGAGLSAADATHPGFLAFYDNTGARVGYVGFNDGGTHLTLTNEGSYTGFKVTGDLFTASGITTQAGPTIRSGAGAATGTQPKGSIWLRTDGAAGSTLYVTQGGGTWAAVAGV